MLPPTTVVAAQMDALQMNDWPDTDSGVRTAFLFSKPFECETMIAGRVSTPFQQNCFIVRTVVSLMRT